jgi:hypothetical protein
MNGYRWHGSKRCMYSLPNGFTDNKLETVGQLHTLVRLYVGPDILNSRFD